MPARSSDAHAAPNSPAASWLWIVAASLLAAIAMAAAQTWHYDATYQWSDQQVGGRERALLFFLVASSGGWALTPGLAIAGGLLLRSHVRSAWLVACASTAAVMLWLGVDLRVDIVTGNHALQYARFLTGEEPWQWAGGLWDVFWPMFLLGSALVLAALLVVGVAWAIAARSRVGRIGAAGATAALAALLFGPTLLAGFSQHPLLLMRLADGLPLEPPFFQADRAFRGGRASLVGELNRSLPAVYARHAAGLQRNHPVEDVTISRDGRPPNVVVIVVESFRHDSIRPAWMPRVDAFAEAHALRSARHYSSSHASHLGLFSLLFGQSPLVYERSLDARMAAQLPHSLRRSDYHAALLSSSALDWQRMDEFLSPRNFDELVIEDEGRWPRRDARTLAHLVRRLVTAREQPLFAFVFLMSTHYNYQYPPEYERHLPVVEKGVLSWDRLLEGGNIGPRYREGLLNRYRNSLAYLDDQLGKLLEQINLERNIVVLTGDHGESFYDDGRWLHGSRLSDAQLRVPFFIAGPGIEPGELSGPTSHLDLLPTLLHAAAGRPLDLQRAEGRDLLTTGSAGPDEALLLVGMGAQHRHLLLLRGEERMHLRLDYEGEALQTLGFLDDRGGYLPEGAAAQSDPLSWLGAVEERLRAVAQ